MTNRYEDKVALVTGAGSGIGRAIAGGASPPRAARSRPATSCPTASPAGRGARRRGGGPAGDVTVEADVAALVASPSIASAAWTPRSTSPAPRVRR